MQLYLFKKDRRKYGCSKAFEKLGAKVTVVGKEDESTNLYLINHQSHLDIHLLQAISQRSLVWIAKKELLKIPFLGYMLKKFHMITVDRQNKIGLKKLVKDVGQRVGKGHVVALFPEGTRVKEQKLKKFKGGAKMIAQNLDLVVQPVVVLGSLQMLDSVKKKYTKVDPRVVFLPPVDRSNPNWYEKIQQDMQTVIDDECKHNNRCR